MKVPFSPEQSNRLVELKETQEKLSTQWIDYWYDYSSFNTWQFWVNVVFIIVPLISLYFFVDRRKIFLLGFFGFNIHVWLVYCDAILTRYNFIEYPYKAIPFLPINVGIDTSLVPILFILLYQWTLNKNKNFYLYSLILITFLSFIFKPLLATYHLIHLKQGMNHIYLFISYIIITLVSIGITNLFQYLHIKYKSYDHI
ncbi:MULTISPECIES: CBO0543 family protein [Metabacillus]|uniref:Uncharacterized protein n=2 Tax=Metabacillus TaxID=2675233 RepID=A0A179SQY3_9BACI|nr:CBO0543 family protein [Metabacillus sp. KUDC1714]OAS84167.1 hypothetical protein A6K24_25700 [Metabacillus litoralis]QNF29908.1 hypothetical protein HUW50_21915 [Metabacillus sp. KUDC1714]